MQILAHSLQKVIQQLEGFHLLPLVMHVVQYRQGYPLPSNLRPVEVGVLLVCDGCGVVVVFFLSLL